MSKVKGIWVLLWEGPNDSTFPDTKIYDTKNKAIMAAIRASTALTMSPFKVTGVYRLELEE